MAQRTRAEHHGRGDRPSMEAIMRMRRRVPRSGTRAAVVETEAADYRDTLLELWPHSIEFGCSEPDCRCGECGCGAGERRLGD